MFSSEEFKRPMVTNLLKKIFGSRNDRVLKKRHKLAAQITSQEETIAALSDDELRAKTIEFRQRLKDGATLESMLSEAFAVVREGGKRALNMRHYDVQMVGAMVLNDGKIAEMRTGEGKTLVATLAVYLNAVEGKGVHLVTVNDYLAQRDADWMGQLYTFLGLSVGVILSGQNPEEKRAAYAADITYGTNNEFGFDYLRDNMAFRADDKVQRGLNFAVIDEVDSILIDEARTPLIISGPADDNSELYGKMNTLIPRLERQQVEGEDGAEGDGDYTVDEKAKQAFLTEAGHQKLEDMLVENDLLQEGESLYDAANIALMHHMNAALRAHVLYQCDVDYIIQNGEVVIVDEFTGRSMPGRRWSEGLHQAVEAKEGVTVQSESQTLASITFQNYFRLYHKLSGMTGTADTEACEFQEIYSLEVVVIPPNRPTARNDMGDLVYLNQEDKFKAILEDIKDCNSRGQPVLVGTTSIEVSELLSDFLEKGGIKHEVLNAKQHAREADVVAQAGSSGAVTIATNMAGRGTDIVLGGSIDRLLEGVDANDVIAVQRIKSEWQKRHDEVLAAGGLHIIGTERHESRRVDNQLRGRSGRQGDVGSSRFYLSLEDNLMRIFASDRVSAIMQKLGMEEGEAIEHPWVSKAIENAQRKVEGHNFDVRKQLLEFDDVANDQRNVIYNQRNELMAMDDIADAIKGIRTDVVASVINEFIPPQSMEEQWNVSGLEVALESEFGQVVPVQQWLDDDDTLHEEILRPRILEMLEKTYQTKEEQAGGDVLRHFEKAVMLQVLDTQWKEHLAAMDYLRQGIHLRGYAQKNPKQEYKREAFEMFTEMLERIKHEVISIVSKVQVQDQDDVDAVDEQRRSQGGMEFKHASASALPESEAETEVGETAEPYVRGDRKVGRNEPCPCGSGKKYKQCHGKLN